jgi:hypothetical protein
VIDLTKWHTWIAFGALLLVWGWLFHQLGARVPAIGTVVKASFGG